MNKILGFFLIFLFLSNCSLDKKSGFWSKPQTIKEDKDYVIKELFKEDKSFDKELNSNVRIKLKSKPSKYSFLNNLSNNNGRINYNGNLKTSSRYKFSKIDNFKNFEPNIVFNDNNVIFFDNKGSILKFDQFSKLAWKKNYYNKSEKKLKPLLNMVSHENYLIVTDNLAKYYAIDVKNGNLLWIKKNISPFNSQIKIYKNYFFVTDFENILRCYLIKTGDEV